MKVLTHNVSKKNDYLHAISPAFLLHFSCVVWTTRPLIAQKIDCTDWVTANLEHCSTDWKSSLKQS